MEYKRDALEDIIMKNSDPVISILKNKYYSIESQIEELAYLVENGIISLSDAEIKQDILKKEEKNLKIQLLKTVHVGKRGSLSMGGYNEAKKLYIVRTADGKKLYSTTEDGLLDKLLVHYGISLDSMLFGDLWNKFILFYEKRHPEKYKTFREKRNDYKRFVSSDLANMDIRKITVDYLEEYSLDLVRNNNLKVSAFKAFKGVLNDVYSYAIRKDIVKENIAKNIDNKLCYEYCDQSLAHRRPDDVLYSEKETEEIFSELFKRNIKYGYYVYYYGACLQYYTGCRPDEMVALKWSDIDFESEIITIQRQQIEIRQKGQMFTYKENTKNEKGVSRGGRQIVLTPENKELLLDLKEKQIKLGLYSDFVFMRTNNTPINKKGYFDCLNALCKKLSIQSKGSYAFRRGYNLYLEKNGVLPSTRAKLLGHSPETNLKNYTVASVEYIKEIKDLCFRSPISHPIKNPASP